MPQPANRRIATEAYVNQATARPRSTATLTTPSLATGAGHSTTITVAKGFRLDSVRTSRPARVRLYSRAEGQTLDAGRLVSEEPGVNSCLLLEYVTTTANEIYWLSPLVPGANLEDTPSAAIPLSVTNNGAAGSLTVTLTYLPTEL